MFALKKASTLKLAMPLAFNFTEKKVAPQIAIADVVRLKLRGFTIIVK